MMNTRSFSIVCGTLALMGAASIVSAQSTLGTPAELPPAGFNGSQYVDSKGCVFISAGVAGSVTWVPRVSRDRNQICGFSPTFAKTAPPARASQSGTIAPARVQVRQATSASVPGLVVAQPDGDAAASLAPTTRFLPRHVYENRKTERTVETPKGFQPAWDDDRLNLRRAEQTLEGRAQMRRIWTDTVPRRLVTQ